MSLRTFHLVFILCAIALALFLGLWALGAPEPPVPAPAAFLLAAALIPYAAWVRRRLDPGSRP